MSQYQITLATVFCGLLVAIEPSSAGKLYKWVDEDGASHYSDRPPAGVPFAEFHIRPAAGITGSENESGIRKAERALLKKARLRDTEIEQARRASAQRSEQRKRRCRQARGRYHDAIHQPGSTGESNFRMFRRKMKDACD